MYLIEILLPCANNDGTAYPREKFGEVGTTLARQFGGVTAFTRAPAHGITEEDGHVVHDDIVVLEVMADTLDHDAWARYRKHLEREFAQAEIVIRATVFEQL